MSAAHTPEPWVPFKDNHDGTDDYGDRYILVFENDYERAKVCVNACAGMSSDELLEFQDGSLKAWIDEAEERLKAVGAALDDVDYSGYYEQGIYNLKAALQAARNPKEVSAESLARLGKLARKSGV